MQTGVKPAYFHYYTNPNPNPNPNPAKNRGHLVQTGVKHTFFYYSHTPTNVTVVLLFEIDDNFSNVKVRMTTNDARCAVVVEHLAQGQTLTTGVEVGVPLSLGYDERGRVV